MYLKTLFISLIVFACKCCFGQTPAQELTNFVYAFPTEKVYFNHDKPIYIAGETIWGKVYLVNGISHQLTPVKPIVYVDWIDPSGKILNTFYLKIDEGIAELDIPVDSNAVAGIYTVRAYTLYQKNFGEAYIFQKEIQVTNFFVDPPKSPDPFDDFSVQFFPEGGEMVAGIDGKIAFKAMNGQGENITVEGWLVDDQDNTLFRLKTLHEGMGFFRLTPTFQKKYRAKFSYKGRGKIFDLPPSLSTGYGIKVDARAKEHIKIGLSTNTVSTLEQCTLIGHLRGQVFMDQVLSKEATINLVLDRAELPTGLLHFTLFDSQKRPVLERLVFNKNQQQQIKVDLQIAEASFKSRSLVTGSIITLGREEIAPSDLSIAVYNLDLIPENSQGITIENYLLLQSDLKGKIANIQQYFIANDAKTRSLLDLLMLTHGWRRFTWQQVLAREKIDLIYPMEESFSISGQVKKEGKNKPVKANVFLNVLDEQEYNFLNVTTGPEGLFFFDGFMFKDTMDLLIQASIFKERKMKKLKTGQFARVGSKFVDLDFFRLEELPFTSDYSLPIPQIRPKEINNFVEKTAEIRGMEVIDSSLWTIDLDAVTVRRKRITKRQQLYKTLKKKYKEKGIFHFGSTPKFFAEDLYRHTPEFHDVFDLIKTAIPGIRLTGAVGNRQIFLGPVRFDPDTGVAGFQEEVTLALDGLVISSNQMNAIPPEVIFSIDVLTGERALAVYGFNPVIALLSKSDEAIEEAISKAQDIGMQQIVHPGFYQAKTFYSPDYSDATTVATGQDVRNTLYWQPNMTITDHPETFSFFTGDIPGNHLIWVEGLTKKGIPFVGHQQFLVSN